MVRLNVAPITLRFWQALRKSHATAAPRPPILLILSILSKQARPEQRSVRASWVRFRDGGPVGRSRTLRDIHVRPQHSGPCRDKVDVLGAGEFPRVQVTASGMNRLSRVKAFIYQTESCLPFHLRWAGAGEINVGLQVVRRSEGSCL